MNALLTILSERAPDSPIMILRLMGRLDASTVGQLERALSDAQQSGVRAILIDLSQLVYVSSSGLRVMLSARSAIRKKGGDIFLCALSHSVREVFDMVGFSAIFSLFETVEMGMEAASILTKTR
jgi:anti-sigma B factor antagonist